MQKWKIFDHDWALSESGTESYFIERMVKTQKLNRSTNTYHNFDSIAESTVRNERWWSSGKHVVFDTQLMSQLIFEINLFLKFQSRSGLRTSFKTMSNDKKNISATNE